VACLDPTCGDLPRRRLDEDRTIAFLERLAALGADGLLIASSTGQGHLRTAAELEAWIRCAARARTGKAMRIALLRPEDGDAANARFIELLAESDYPVVFLRPGNNLADDADDVDVCRQLAPLVALAAGARLAIGLYTIPDISGLPLSPCAAARLVNLPGGQNIVAIKVTEPDYQNSTARFLAEKDLQHLKIVQGWDPHIERALKDGPLFDALGRQRVGITSGLMSLAIYQYLHMLKAATQDDWEELTEAQKAATTLFSAMQDEPGSFADLQRAKYIMGLGQPITGTVETSQVERVFTALEGLARTDDRERLARSLDLMGDGPFHRRLNELCM